MRSPFLPAISWLIVSIILLTLPGSNIPNEDWFGKIWIDKWVHLGMFALMVFLWCRVILKRNPANKKLNVFFFLIAGICLAYGTGMEFVQKFFITNRSFDLGDIIADAVGCSIGLLFCTIRYIKK